MGTCMSSRGQHHKSTMRSQVTHLFTSKRVVEGEANALLNQWNQKHIEILKQKFNESILARKNRQRGLDRPGFMKVFSDLKDFPKSVQDQAFKLFDKDGSGYVDFKEFCLGLSVVCLSNPSEKLRFVFDLFDLDRDQALNKQEFKNLLDTSVKLFRKFSKQISADTKTADQQWIEAHMKTLFKDAITRVVFEKFQVWAENNLNLYHLINSFEVVPSPSKERLMIMEILLQDEQQHGDTMYVLNYRWWDTWTQYTTEHSSTVEQANHIQRMKHAVDAGQRPESDKTFLKEYIGAYEERKGFDEVIKNKEMAPYSLQKEASVSFEEAEIGQEIGDEQIITNFAHQDSQLVSPKSIRGSYQGNKKLLRPLKKESAFGESYVVHTTQENGRNQGMREKNLTTLAAQMSVQNKPTLFRNEIPSSSVRMRSGRSITQLQKRKSTALAHIPDLDPEASGFLPPINDSVHEDPLLSSMGGPLNDGTASMKYFTNEIENKSFPRPQPIDNIDLEGENPGQLRPNLLNYRDYVLVPEKAWQLFMEWYGGGQPAFPRKVISNNGKSSIELYPPLVTSVLCGQDGNPVEESSRSLFVSLGMKLSEVFLKICECYNQLYTKDSRLWLKQDGTTWKLLLPDQMESSLEEFILKEGDVFMVEMKFGTDMWPRDKKNEGQEIRDWRQFEVGDKIDVFEEKSDSWVVGRVNKTYKEKVTIHIEHTNWRNDVTLPKDSNKIEQYGKHTFEALYKIEQAAKQDELPLGLIGIENIGNTCYMNAVLQALMAAPLFKEYLLSNEYLKHLKEEGSVANDKKPLLLQRQSQPKALNTETLTYQMAQLIQEAHRGVKKLPPTSFKRVVNNILSDFYGQSQHDAQEFLIQLLDKMSEEIHRQPEEVEPPQPLDKLQRNDAPKPEEKPRSPEKETEKKENSQSSVQPGGEARVQTVSQPNLDQEPNLVDGGTGAAQETKKEETSVVHIVAETQENEQNPLEEVQERCNVTEPLKDEEKTKAENVQTMSDTAMRPENKGQGISHKLAQPEHESNTPDADSLKEEAAGVAQEGEVKPESTPAEFAGVGEIQKQHSAEKEHTSAMKISEISEKPEQTETLEEKAQKCWERELKWQNSAITDLMVGQQINTVTCLTCQNKTHMFENFKTISLSLPYNSKCNLFINVVRRSDADNIQPIVKYGISMLKKQTMGELLMKIQEFSGLPVTQFSLVEIVNSRIFKVFGEQDYQKPLLQVNRFTNELYVFQKLEKWEQFPVSIEKAAADGKGSRSQSTKPFKSVRELRNGMNIEAQDRYQKWYVGVVCGQGLTQSGNEQVKVHFYNFPDKWDEWYSDEHMHKLGPLGKHRAVFKDKFHHIICLHRRVIQTSESDTKQQNAQQEPETRAQMQYIGMPFTLSVGSWYTWRELATETMIQAQRFVKFNESVTLSQRTKNPSNALMANINENVSEEDSPYEGKFRKIAKYDSSQFGNKMAQVQEQKKPKVKPQLGPLQTKGSEHDTQPLLDVNQSDIQIDMQQQEAQERKGTGTFSKAREMGRKVSQSYRQDTMKTPVMQNKKMVTHDYKSSQTPLADRQGAGAIGPLLELDALPFVISIHCAETKVCLICMFKHKYVDNRSREEVVKCVGCDITLQDDQEVKFVFSLAQAFEINLTWRKASLYRNPIIRMDENCIKLQKREQEVLSGIPISQCFDLMTKKEKIEDFSCDNCKKRTVAVTDSKISKAPDILILHFKRFSYSNGFLEKIEDLVTFPDTDLDIKSLCDRQFLSMDKSSNIHSHYELFACVNHHMLQNQGGHYTASILLQENSKQANSSVGFSSTGFKPKPSWYLTSDGMVIKQERKDIMTRDAFILFYKRKELTAANVVNLKATDGV